MLDREKIVQRVLASTVVLGLMWTVVLGTFCGWTVTREFRAADRILHEQGVARFDLDQAFRFWATGHGGVYVPVSEKTPPNPHLAHVPDRDIVTPSGLPLTLMNPAYMLRQLNEQFPVLYGVSGHVTSLKPLRPENAPDDWEKKALHAFEEGVKEVAEETEIAGVPHLRLMRPMMVKQGCLKCHQHQGYKVGDVRGGVSVSLPSGAIRHDARDTAALLGFSFAVIWLLGLAGIVWNSNRLSGHFDKLADASTALAGSERLLEQERRLFIAGPTVVFRWRAAEGWPVIYVSPNITEVFGYDPEDLLSGMIPFAEIVHPEDLERVAGEVTQHVEEGASRFMQEYRLRCTDGHWAPIRDWTIVERGEDGSPSSFLGYILDVTEQEQAAEHRRRLESQIQHSQKLESLGVLAGGIAHDFNNLLMVILGNADLARELLGSSHPADSHLLDIETASKRAADLCCQMLAYSGKGRFVIEKLDLQAAVHEITHMLEVSISKNVVLRFDFAANLPPIEADASQVNQIVMNLVTNASEAIGECSGVVSIRTGAMECDKHYLSSVFQEGALEEGIYVYLEVADTGSGMSDEVADRVFEPFFTTKFTGRGLGMAAVLGIVRGHGGAIKIYSELGQGTTIKVLFPAAEGEATESSDTVSEEEASWRGSGLVLVVDDEETIRALAGTMLRRMGFDVITAADGREGLDLFRKHRDKIRFVLLDLTMPHMNGEDAFREIRQVDGNAKVLMTSGYNEQEIVQRFAGKGLAGFVQKPFQRSMLRKCIRELL